MVIDFLPEEKSQEIGIALPEDLGPKQDAELLQYTQHAVTVDLW